LIFIYLGIKGIRDCIRFSEPKIFILAFAGYMIVGLGSMAFHTTLKCQAITGHPKILTWVDSSPDSMQLSDELPMIYTTCVMGYASLSYARSSRFAAWTAVAMVSLAAIITVSKMWFFKYCFPLISGAGGVLYHPHSRVPSNSLRNAHGGHRLQRLLPYGEHRQTCSKGAESRQGGRYNGTDVETFIYW
jgi:hypothetical protein